MINPTCPYCGALSHLTRGTKLYPHLPELAQRPFWRCDPCDAHVGCHPGKYTPLGSLANKELRDARRNAHLEFDTTWKGKRKSRSAAYAWLSRSLGIAPADCHIGMFDLATCQRALDLMRARDF